MKKIAAAILLAIQPFYIQAQVNGQNDLVSETELIKNENIALKNEITKLREQLKIKNEISVDRLSTNQDSGSTDSLAVSNTKSSDQQQETLSAGSQSSITAQINDDLRISVGTKLWINKWEKFFPDNFNTTVNSVLSDTELTPIPTASIKYKDFFISGSYFAETEYAWNYSTILQSSFGPLSGSKAQVHSDGSRREFDVAAGYFVHPNLALTAGYKDIRQKFTNISLSVNTTTSLPLNDAVVEYSGPFVGLIGLVPIGKGFGLYGNFAYGWLNFDGHGYAGVDNRDTIYILADGGISYTYNLKEIASFPLSVSAFAGYRYQSLEVDDVGASHSKVSDYTKGFVTGINMSF